MTEEEQVTQEAPKQAPVREQDFIEEKQRLWEQGDWKGVVALYEEVALGEGANGEVDWLGELSEGLETHNEVLPGDDERAEAWHAIGELSAAVGDLSGALEAFQRASSYAPEDPQALWSMREIHEAREEWDAVVTVCQALADAAEEAEEKASILTEKAQVQGELLDDRGAAIETLEEVLECGVEDPFVDQVLGFYMEDQSLEEGVELALRDAEEALNEGDGAVACESFIGAAQLEFDRYGGSSQEALRLVEMALEADPESEDAALIAEELMAEITDEEEQEGADEEPAVEASQPEEERSVETLLADVEAFDGQLDEALEKAKSERTNLSVVKRIRQIWMEEIGDVHAWVDWLDGVIRYFRKKEGEWELMTELANLYWLELGDDEKAEYYFKRLKLIDDGHPDVFKFYEAYYEQEGDYINLFNLLKSRLDRLDDRADERLIVEQLAEMAEYELGNPSKAIDVWKRFSRRYPEDEEATRRLKHLYEDHGKWNALVDLLQDEIRRLDEDGDPSGERRISLLEERAHIYRSELGVESTLMRILADILEIDGDHPSAFGELRDLYESKRRFNDLAELLETQAERCLARGETATAVGYLWDVATLWEEELNNQTQAIPYLERILEVDPADQEVRSRLREIYEKRRDFKSLFDLRVAEARLLGAEEQGEELRELRSLAQEKLSDPGREARVLESLLELEGEREEWLETLEGIRREQGKTRAVAELLERRAGLVEEASDEVELLWEASQLWRELDGHGERAVELWHQVLTLDGSHEDAFQALDQHLEKEGDWDALVEHYADAGRHEALYDRLGELAEAQEGEAEALLEERVRVAREGMGSAQAVVSALETLRDHCADSDAVRRRLLEWYPKIGDVESEVQTRQILLEGMDDVDERTSQMLVLADLEEGREAPSAALGWLVKCLDEGREMGLLERAEELAIEVSEVDAFVEHLDGWSMEWEEGIELRRRAARLVREVLKDEQAAIERYEALAAEQPQSIEWLRVLEGLYDQAARPADRMEVLKKQLQIRRQEGAAEIELVDLLSGVADIQRDHLEDLEAAGESYSQILDMQPDHLGAVRGKKELYRIDERWEDVVDYLLREIPLAAMESPEQAWEAKLELADVHRQQLGDRREALRYYGEVLGEEPEHEAALTAVRQLLGDDELAREAALLLEPIFRQSEQAAPLAEALEARLRVSDDPYEEQEILDELIPLYAEELEELEVAFEYARRQFEIDPERDDIWLRVEQLGAALDKWELLEEMFSQESPLAGHESSTRYDLLRHLAAIREHRLQDKEGALEAWEKLHDYDPLDQAVLEALERLYRAGGEEQEALAEVLSKRAQLVDRDDDRVELLLESATIQLQALEDSEVAEQHLREVLSLEPEHHGAVTMLVDILEEQHRWHDLDDLLSDQAMQTLDPDRRRSYRRRLARLRYEEVADYAGAVRILRELLDDDPGDDEVLAFAQEADEVLADEGHRDLRLELHRTLEPLYRMRGEAKRLVASLELRLEEESGHFEQVEILDEIVEVRQKRLSDPEGALEALQRAVVVDPEDEDRRKKMLEMASGLDALEEALDVLEQAAEGADGFVALDIWQRIAKLAAQKLNDPERAIDYYRRARRLDDGDRGLMEALERLYEATGQSAELCENLLEQARFAAGEERQSMLRRAATLQHHVLEEKLDAIETYRQLLEIDPDDRSAMDALEDIYEERGEYLELLSLFRRKVDLLETDEKVELFQRWAAIAEDELGDRAQAIEVRRRLLEVESGHAESLEELSRLLAEELEWGPWAEVVEERVERWEGAPEGLTELELSLATTVQRELYETERAVAIYRRIIEREGDEPRAVEALESLAEEEPWFEELAPDLAAIYRRQERWEDLVRLMGRQADVAMDPSEKAQWKRRQALVYRDHLEDPEEALAALTRAWQLDVDEGTYLEEMIALGQEEELWRGLVDGLEAGLDQVLDPQVGRELRLLLVQWWRDELDDAMEAEGHLRFLVDRDPTDPEAFPQLTSLLEAQERWFDLVELLERRHDAVVSEDPAQATQLLMTVVELQRDAMDDGFEAVETLRRIRQIDERHQEATQLLEQLLADQERWEDLERLYLELADETPLPSERLEWELKLAELYRGALKRPRRAVELYGDAIEIDAEHDAAIAALEELFESTAEVRVEAAQCLEPVYRSRGEVAALVEVLLAKAAATEVVDERGPWLKEALGLLVDDLEDPRRAWAVAADRFSDRPDDQEAWGILEGLTRRAGAWDVLADLVTRVLKAPVDMDVDTRGRLRRQLAEIYVDRLDETVEGREHAKAALDLVPEDEATLSLMERVLQRQRAWHDLAEFYRRQAEYSAEKEVSLYWYEKLAALYEDVIDDVDATVQVYGQLLELAPGDERYRSAMERLLATVERWYDLADIYRQRIAGESDPGVVRQNRLALAGLLEKELESPEDAISMYRQVLEEAPGHSDAIRALEGMRRDLEVRDGDWVYLRRTIIDTLLEAYDASRAWRRVDDLLDERVQLAERPEEQVELLVEKAQLVMRSTEDALERVHALTTLARALCLDPTNEEIEELIEMLGDDLDAWQRVVPIYLRALGTTDDVDKQGHILAAVARIYEEKIRDRESAVAAYQQSVEISMESEVAIAKLEELYTEMGKYEPLVDILERRLEEVFDPDRQRSLRKRVARVCDEKLRDPRRALEHYRELRRETPEEMTQIVVVERLLETLGDYEALEDLLLEKLQYVDTPHLRAKAFRRLGEIRRDHLGRVDEAIGSFRDAREVYPEDEQALEALMELYQQEGRWHHMLDTMVELREQSRDAGEIADLTLEMGDIYIDELGDPAAALAQYKAVLESDSDNYQARGALFRLLNEDEVRHEASHILVDIHREAGEWEELEALYERLVESSEAIEEKGKHYLSLAKLQENEVGVAFKAFATLSEAMNEVASVAEVRSELERLADDLGSSEDLVVIYEEALQSGVEDDEARAALHRKVGQAKAKSQAFESAIGHLEAVLEVDEYDQEALDWLDQIYQAQENWVALIDVLEKKLAVVSGEKLRQTQFQLGYLREMVQEDLEGAFELYREVLLAIPDHRGAIEGLERLCAHEEHRAAGLELLEPTYEAMEQWAKLARLYELKLQDEMAEERRGQLLRRLATLELEELDKPDQAFEHFGEVFGMEPHDGALEERLRGLARDYDLFQPTVVLFIDICDGLEDDHRRLALAQKAGEWAELHVGDQRLAARAFRHVLDVDPADEQALRTLEKVAREEGDASSLAAVLKAKLELSDQEEDRLDLLRELASVQLQGDDAEGAIESLERLQEMEGVSRDRLETLAELYRKVGDDERRAEALERLMEDEEDKPFDWLIELGELAVGSLEAPRRARKAFEEAREQQPDHPSVLQGLADVYEALDDWELLESILGRQIQLLEVSDEVDGGAERIALHMRRGELRESKADDLAGAVEDYRSALELGADDAAFEALSQLFEENEGWDELLQLWEWRIDHEELEQATERLLEMASIAEMKLDDRQRAVDYLETVLNVVKGHEEALDRLERLHRDGEDWSSVVEVLDRRIAMASEDGDIQPLWEERARVLDEEAGKLAEAVEVYERLIAMEGDSEKADQWRQRRREIYEELGDGKGLYAIMEERLTTADEDDQIEIYLEMAEVAQTYLSDAERRLSALESARAIAGDELTIVEPLLDAYIEAEALDKAEPLLASVIETLNDARKMKEAVRFIHLRGKLAEQRGDADAALEAYDEAQRIDATYIPNMLSRGRVLLESGDYEGAKKNFQVLLLHHTKIKDPAKKVAMYYHLGEARRHLGEERGARDMYKRALRIDSDHGPSQEGLELVDG